MPKQNIIVVGTSAGGVEALKVLAAGFPADLAASVFVVIHVGKGIRGHTYMPEILSNAGPLPAVRAEDGGEIQPGTIYVAPPDYHMLLSRGMIQLSRGPKENFCRPAINPLFRSAAEAYDGNVAGVILTGLLDDGVAGLAHIKRRGGVAVVEDPETAAFPGMPMSALHQVEADYVAPLPSIAGIISTLTVTERPRRQRDEPMEIRPTKLTCPECRGPLSEECQGHVREYSCRVGHRYSPLAMQEEHRGMVEENLWKSILSLEEAADIAESLSAEAEARKSRAHAAALRAIVSDL